MTTPPADLEPRSLATASARRTLELYRRLQYRVRKGKLAKSVPPWALPRELWRIILCPNHFQRMNPNSLDPDANVDIYAPRVKNAVLDLLGSMITCGRLAFLMNRSMGTYIPKTNGQRLIHSLCPLART